MTLNQLYGHFTNVCFILFGLVCIASDSWCVLFIKVDIDTMDRLRFFYQNTMGNNQFTAVGFVI